MNTAENTTETVVAAAPAAKPLKTLADVQAFVITAITGQSEVEIVSCEIVEVKADGKKGKRVELVLSGAGVGNSTRRYFLRNNSLFASTIRGAEGLVMAAPKKSRDAATYQLNFGLNETFVNYEEPAPAKAEKVKLTKEEARDRRIAGKIAARQRREAEAAAAAAAEAEATPEAEADTAPALESGEPVVLTADESELAAA